MAKLCKDCRHYTEFMLAADYCTRYSVKEASPVNGEVWLSQVTNPIVERRSSEPGRCGPDARHFEPKPPLWKRILQCFK